jgi:hypothetical protein
MSTASDRPSRPPIAPGEPRPCPRCGAEVPCERHDSEHSVTWIWRCACGWGSARADSGVVSRNRAREAIDRALGGSGDDG